MKGFGKRLLALALAIALTCGSGMTVFASNSGNTTLIKKSETVKGYTQVGPDSTAAFTLDVKRVDDEFNMYQLTKVTWGKSVDGIDIVTVEWIDEVQAFIDGNAEFSGATFLSSDGTIKNTYATPENLGEAEDTTTAGVYVADSKVNETYVIDLLKAIRKDDGVMAALKTKYIVGYHGKPYDTANNPATPNDGNSTYVAADTENGEPGKADVTATYKDSDFQYSYTVDKMPVGLCFVDVVSGARTYQPVLLDLMPIQVGPTGNWYVKNTQEYSLKYEDAGISKKINGNNYDIVREGEIVSFEIRVDVPIYQKNADGNYEYTLFNISDKMAQGFTLIPTSATFAFYDKNDTLYQPTAKLTFNPDGSVTAADADTGVYSTVMADKAYVYYSKTDGRDVFYGTPTTTSGQVQFWGLINGVMTKLGAYTESTTTYGTVINAYNGKVDAADKLTYAGTDIERRETTESLMSVNIDYTKLMDTIKVGENDFTPDYIVIRYDALVNDNSYVGTDENTNDVFLHYIGDSAGNQYTSQDEVKAWTYAANIVKVDGNTVNVQATDENGDPRVDGEGNPVYEDPTYLDGAIFDLYRLDTTYCGGATATVEPAETDYANYNFLSDADGRSVYDDSRAAWLGTVVKDYKDGLLYKAVYNHYAADKSLTEVEKSTKIAEDIQAIVASTGEYSTLDQFTNKYGAFSAYKTIFNEYVMPKVTGMTYQYVPVKVDFCGNCTTPHYHVEAYVVFWNDITSTDTEEGITVTGLDPNTYLLVETQAPSGYHELSTALKFELKKYNEAQANASGSVSYKGFVDDGNNDVNDGIYDIVVENFAGLVLPSTGGMGTLLFTIIGIMIMASAIVIIVTKSKRRQDAGIY